MIVYVCTSSEPNVAFDGFDNVKITVSSASSNVSAVSTHASYEASAAGTVILEKPQRSDFKGRSGQANFNQAMVTYNDQKAMLNSYQKTQVKASLAKI